MRAVIFDCFGVLTKAGSDKPDDELFAYIRDELKPHYRLGIISNAASNMLGELFEPWQVKLFDDAVLSYETGTVKPEPDIYQLAAARLGVLPEECLFVDDIERYCTAATEQGMVSVWHQDTKETIAKMKELLHA